jgi:hypothetical protein
MLLMHVNKTNCELPNTAVYQHLQSEFLLANTMSVLQPMDQHIIEALKHVLQVPYSKTAVNIQATVSHAVPLLDIVTTIPLW